MLPADANLIDYAIPAAILAFLTLGLVATAIGAIRHRLSPAADSDLPPVIRPTWPRRADPAPPPAPAPTPPTWLAEPAEERMPAQKWLRLLNDQPDDLPHMMIVGPTGAGKTTFATALLGRRAGRVVVLSPKVKPSDWGGAPVVSLDDTGGYGLLVRAVAALESERRRRLVALRQGAGLEPLTIVLDEVPDLVDYVRGTGDLIRSIGGMGRELDMRMLLCSSSTLVNDLGIKGRGSARSNYAQVQLSPAVGTTPRTGTLTWGRVRSDLDLKLVPPLAQQSELRARGWAPPVARVFADEDLAMLIDPIPAQDRAKLAEIEAGLGEEFSEPETAPERRGTDDDGFPETWKLLIAQGIGAGKSKTDIITGLPGYSGRKYRQASDLYDQVMRGLGLVLEER